MDTLLTFITSVCGRIQVVSDLFWNFPTNFDWYAKIPIIWDLSDFANILIAFCNIPLLYIGFKYVNKARMHYEKEDGTPFTSKVAGVDVPVWDEKATDF